MRALAVLITLLLMTIPTLAASLQVQAAVKAIQTVGTAENILRIGESRKKMPKGRPVLFKSEWINCLMSLERISKPLGRLPKLLIQHPRTAKYFLLH